MQTDILSNDDVAQAIMYINNNDNFDKNKIYVSTIRDIVNNNSKKEYTIKHVGQEIERLAPIFRKRGIEIEKVRTSNGVKVIMKKML